MTIAAMKRSANKAYNLYRLKTCAQNSSSSRHFSSTNYQYPLHTETPVITRSTAPSDPHSSSSSTKPLKSYPPPGQTDHFDDALTLTPTQRTSVLSSHRLTHPTTLTSTPLHGPILPTVPLYLPPNHPRTTLSLPSTELTTLPNGLRVASQETYGQVCTFGIVSNCGSRLEIDGVSTGSNHLLELLAFGGSEKRAGEDIGAALDSIGGTSFANASREQFLYCIDVLRPNVSEAMEVLGDVFLHPRMGEEDVDHVKKVVEYQWMDMLPEVRLGEGLQTAAYRPAGEGGVTQQLGRPHFCPMESLGSLTAESLTRFREEHLLNPEEMVLAGAGIRHEELVELAEKHFGHLAVPAAGAASSTIVPSVYTGGDYRQTVPTPDGFTRIALAFPTLGWTSTHDVLSTCILQTLLGGGNSFSAGGPGKGMYSRLYRQVLNRYHWAESCEAFTSFHNEAGLVGMGGSAVPERGGDVVRVLAEHFKRLESDVVEDEEFDRARNMLKCNVLTQLESRLVLFEDVGRQILTYGKREGTEEMCEKIDAVTKEDLRDLVRRALGTDGKRNVPTLSVVGDRVDYVPSQDEVRSWFTA